MRAGAEKHRFGAFVALGTATVLLFSGCATQLLAARIVKAPNRQGVSKELRKATELGQPYLKTWRISVGPPRAELSVGVLEPGDYSFTYTSKDTATADGGGHFDFDGNVGKPVTMKDTVPKGTLVLLHGIMMNKESMLVPWGFFFAQHGYRVVLVDLRGHGGSTGDWIGFGAWEVADLMKVTDELQRRGLLVGGLGVFGISYGAAVGIQWAARDPRVATLVALAPYSDPRRAIIEFARGYQPKLAGRFSDTTFAAAEDRAAALAGFAWSDADVLGAMKAVRVPVLFFHGDRDTWIAPQQSERLAEVAPKGSRRVVLPMNNHVSLAFRLEPIGPEALAWFEGSKLEPAVGPAGKK